MQICDLRILTAEFDDYVSLGMILLDSLCLCHYFLCKLESEPVGNGKSAGTRNGYRCFELGELLIKFFEKLIQQAGNIGMVPSVFAVNNLLTVEKNDLNRRRTYIKS